MPHCLSPANCLPLIGRIRRRPCSPESWNESNLSRPHSVSTCSPLSASNISREAQLPRIINSPGTTRTIQDLDEDSLLHIFYLFWPSLLETSESGETFWDWTNQSWWNKLVQVCRRWRHLILRSASHLHLCLVHQHGTPVADMLAHSPPFPLVIGFNQPNRDLTAEDEEGIKLVLQHRDCVRFIFLDLTAQSLKRLLPALDDQFPVLEYLHIAPPAKHNTHFTLPSTFEAPRLHHVWLSHFASPIGSPLLLTAIGLVTLTLDWIRPSSHPHPNNFLQLLSHLPLLETIRLSFCSSIRNRDIERQMLQTPIIIHVVHPNLRLFDFIGVSSFLEAILPHLATPLLEEFRVHFFNQLLFSVPHLANFMNTKELKPIHIKLTFHHKAVILFLDAAVGGTLNYFELTVSCRHLDWQVSSVTQILNVLHPLLSDVGDLTLDYREHTLSSEWHNQADHTHWRQLLGFFRNVKMLRVHDGLVGAVSRFLRLDGEPPLEILPELKEFICPTRCVDDRTFAPFIWEQEDAGQPVSLIGEKFPVGRFRYTFYDPTGKTNIEPD